MTHLKPGFVQNLSYYVKSSSDPKSESFNPFDGDNMLRGVKDISIEESLASIDKAIEERRKNIRNGKSRR